MNQQPAEVKLVDVVRNAKGTFGGLQDILDWLREQLSVDGICLHKAWMIAQADAAIDQIVAVDLPYVPNLFEPFLDDLIGRVAKAKVRSMIARVCP